MDIVRFVDQELKRERLLKPEDSIVAAVSGGPDSVAMLHILFLLSGHWKWRLVVAHVNHRFRGTESDAEASYVQELAAGLGLPCEVGTIDVPAYIQANSLNPQSAARDLRYDFLLDVAERRQCRAVVTAHHAGDQAETVIMRFLRGAGLSGLSGISFTRTLKSVELIRPFLRITKGELLSYCKQQGLAYCEDSSNTKRNYLRNRVRLDLLPVLESFNPRLQEALGRMAETLREEDDFMEREARAAFDRFVTVRKDVSCFSASALTSLHVALQRRIVKLILNYLFSDPESADFIKIERVREAALQQAGGTIVLDLGGQVKLVREYDIVRLSSADAQEETAKGFHYIWEPAVDPVLHVPEAGVRFECDWISAHEAEEKMDKATLLLDIESILFPLQVRNRRDGDRMRILGLNGRKKVKDIFIDEKIPPSIRERLPLLLDQSGSILWIPGVRQSEESVVSPSAGRVLRIKRIDLNPVVRTGLGAGNEGVL